MAKALYVDDVHLLTTRSRPPLLIVTAHGRVTTTGWSNARLEPYVYVVPPADGFQDLDLVATPPSGPAGQALSAITAGTRFWLPDWCKGVRVHASTNSVERSIPGMEPVELIAGGGDIVGNGKAVDDEPGDSWSWLIAPGQLETLQCLTMLGATAAADAKVSELIGHSARVIRDGDPMDMMYFPERVTIVLGCKDSTIIDVRFG